MFPEPYAHPIICRCKHIATTDHLCQGLDVPKKSTLYSWRVDFDLASMVFARMTKFNMDKVWRVHIRLDASPQFGRDWLMGEVDLMCLEGAKTWADLQAAGRLQTRLLVCQTLGARAAGVAVKTKKLLHMLSLATCLQTD